MISILGYNFCFDKDAINAMSTNLNNITSSKIQNGIFDHYNITRDTSQPYSSTIPTAWDFFTIMDANFEGNINAGNVEFALSLITSIKVKRRVVGDFNWITLVEIPINSQEDLKFSINDYFNQNDVNYEYALVPTISGAEGDYLTNQIYSQFNGVFICDYETIFRFYAGVKYGNTESVQRVGVYEPIGAKYPIVVANANTDYRNGSISATMMPNEFYENGTINRQTIVQYTNLVEKFLKNKRAKIIKDFNGNTFLVMIIGNPSLSYTNEYGMGIIDTSFAWTEQGDPNNQADLYANGLVSVIE